MKRCKLQVHQPNFSDEDLLLNSKDFPSLNIRDVVEIYDPADEFSRLLLQVTCLKDDLQSKDTISVKHNIAKNFRLKNYSEVIVNVVDPKNVALDSVELTFKDQYLARGDMWRLKQNMDNTCVYMQKTVEFAGIRTQVYEMWSQGERVASGVVTHDTKVVFRSSTSMVYLFLQMSSEMWDFDINGDLYFEKGVYGFLADLFAKWKKNGCNHDVTVVLFSRSFYKAQSIEEFPEHMRECLQKDYKGRFYEDFYRVAIQNERYDDWSNILVELKRLFYQYNETVLRYHEKPGVTIPEVYNSTAAQGNFLEVLNMSLNVFERHYTDRSLDRTGQLSVVITPGVGVFEVDRELANVTKQRIIDSGIGSDLVCLGEQPLHAVPLFKFQSKQQCYSVVDDYNMPHWINLSFYSCPNKRLGYSNFVPRLKLPANLMDEENSLPLAKSNNVYSSKGQSCDETFPLCDYDSYDAEIFKHGGSNVSQAQLHTENKNHTQNMKSSGSLNKISSTSNFVWRKMSEDKTSSGTLILPYEELPSPGFSSSASSRSSAINIPSSLRDGNSLSVSYGTLRSDAFIRSPSRIKEDSDTDLSKSPLSRSSNRMVVGSADNIANGRIMNCQSNLRSNFGSNRNSRALINPFDPSHLTIKLTSNRRRWTHVFPIGPKGGFMQEHHRKVQPENSDLICDEIINENVISQCQGVLQAAQLAVQARKMKMNSIPEKIKEKSKSISTMIESPPINMLSLSSAPFNLEGSFKMKQPTFKSSSYQGNDFTDGKNLLLAWGATGEQEWSPGLTTGVDWKSLTIPACLPITTDYFPDKRSLQNDYVISDYCLYPDDINADLAPMRNYESGELHKNAMSANELFKELVLQRLQQSFQIIHLSKNHLQHVSQIQISSSPQFTPNLARSRSRNDFGEEYLLSIGRIFHKISLVGPMITVTQFRPRHPYPQIKVQYRYRFQAPDNVDYGVSWVYFTTQLLENYGWNYLDHYICMKGEGDYTLKDAFKYWRINVAILPIISATTKKIIENTESIKCDIYPKISEEEQYDSMEGFCKFMEVLNNIKRPHNTRKQMCHGLCRGISNMGLSNPSNCSAGSVPGPSQGQSAAFRERVSSNRVHDRPRSISGSKLRERNRSESGNISNTAQVPPTDLLINPSDSLKSLSSNDSQGEFQISNPDLSENATKLSAKTSTHAEIVEVMKSDTNGLSFLMKHPGLPPWSFICFEAVNWLQAHVDGIGNASEAVLFLENLRSEGIICHASRIKSFQVLNGFYIYFIVNEDSDIIKSIEDTYSSRNIEDFQKQWFEIEMPKNTKKVDDRPSFLQPFTSELNDGQKNQWKPYKYTTLELDSGSRKDGRLEWGSALYHSLYKPSQAFEIIVQWMVATGSILSDLLQQWQRKATSCGLVLIPIPSDPFALPFSGMSDPLRGPVFVPLEIDCLLAEGKKHLFEGYSEDEQERRLVLFQEAIAQRFGFIPMQCELQHTVGGLQYIHLSGGMFVMITHKTAGLPNQIDDFKIKRPEHVFRKRQKNEVPQATNPHQEYITRHVTTRSSNPTNPSNKVGFLWSWNHMLSKRWRSQSTGEVTFQDKILADFLNFCSNKENRLKIFWDESVRANKLHE